MQDIYIIFTSHRARENALKLFTNRPQAYYSFRRNTFHGVYLLTAEQYNTLKENKRLKGYRKLRGPFDDIMQCFNS